VRFFADKISQVADDSGIRRLAWEEDTMQIDSIRPIGESRPAPEVAYTHYLRPDVLQAVADKLGMSVPELQAQLQGSHSLSRVARSRGVSMQEIQQSVGSVGSYAHEREHPETIGAPPYLRLPNEPGEIVDVLV
jgi:hypothetical protein